VQSTQSEPARAVLLGASNLTIGLRHALAAASARVGAPLEVLAALGRGRSYGTDSWFLCRRLPGISSCGLWRALQAGEPRPCWALVTDVGNDLPYGATPASILGWVEQALDRLDAAGARTVITSLPLDNLRRIPAWQLELWRKLIFPLHRTSRETILARAEVLDAGLRALASQRGLALVEHQPSWYGADPIHVRRSQRAQAWSTLLAPWGAPSPRAAPVVLPPSWSLVPERRWILGLEGGRPQPCARLADGSTLSLY
jgi:hypothetical protein